MDVTVVEKWVAFRRRRRRKGRLLRWGVAW
jgi:hypothetical protein